MSGFSVPSKKAPYPQNRESVTKKRDDLPVELESQFILKLPEKIASEVRAVVRSGAMNLKDRLKLKIEHDNRRGEVIFDNNVLDTLIVDLPTVVESHKSLDSKTFYKTADICQMMTCTEKDDNKKVAEEETQKKKDKKDKKHLYPHGITPPLKNVRKRRFRKTLKKKYADAPETEKEVKRLFRVDNEAVSVRWEIVTGDEELGKGEVPGEKSELVGEVIENPESVQASSGAIINDISQSADIEHHIFGGVLSDSDIEDDVNIIDSADDETSRFSTGLGLAEDEDSELKQDDKEGGPLVTQFSRSMLDSPSIDSSMEIFGDDSMMSNEASSPAKQEKSDSGSSGEIMNKIVELEQDIADICARKQEQIERIAQIKNQALQQRLQEDLEELRKAEAEKQEEYNQMILLLNQS